MPLRSILVLLLACDTCICLSHALRLYTRLFQPQNLTFVHIPKNMGLAIESFGEKYGVWGSKRGHGLINGLYCHKEHIPPADWSDSLGHNPYNGDTFCVSRNPYSRAISLYIFQTAWPPQLRNASAPPILDACSPNLMNQHIQKRCKLLQQGHSECFNLQQTRFIFAPDGHQTCKHIFRMDEMPNALNQLLAEKNYSIRVPQSISENFSNERPICQNLTVSNLSSETKAMIQATYREDFERLGYDM